MNTVPDKIKELLKDPPTNGKELVSLTRAIVDEAEDWEDEDYQIFIGIESQIDHVELESKWRCARPMSSVDLSKGFSLATMSNFETPVMSPTSNGYEEELADIHKFFYADFMSARHELLAKSAFGLNQNTK